MFAKERQSKITEILNAKQSVTTAQLLKEFDVSVETVRRDLLEMEKEGKLVRVHGGAIKVGEMKKFSDLSHRLEENINEKEELCRIAAKTIQDGDIIYIDSGSTAVHFSQIIKKTFAKLTIVTHSIDVFEILSEKDGFEVILCGGFFNKSEKAFYGKLVVDTIKNLNVKKAYIFPSAISLNKGVGDFCQELLVVQQAIMEQSEMIYFLADSEKFEKQGFLKLCDMTTGYTFITDSGLNDSCRELYNENNIKILTGEDKVNL